VLPLDLYAFILPPFYNTITVRLRVVSLSLVKLQIVESRNRPLRLRGNAGTVATLLRVGVVHNGRMSGDTVVPDSNGTRLPFQTSLVIPALVNVVVEEFKDVFCTRKSVG